MIQKQQLHLFPILRHNSGLYNQLVSSPDPIAWLVLKDIVSKLSLVRFLQA